MRLLLTLALASFCLSLSSCGKDTTTVKGKVTYQGKTVVFGTVVLVGPDGVPKNGAIQPDGTFTVSGMKTGTAKVAVTSPAPPGAKVNKPVARGRDADDDRRPAEATENVNPEVAKNWFPLPKELGYHDSSKVTVDVISGQDLNIDLK